MCGIVGALVDQAQDTDALSSRVATGLDALVHRGPDSGGQRSMRSGDSVCVLGARRLRIIDLSTDADQPLTNEDGSVTLVFNGEIYNYAELRHDLEQRGHVFGSRTDGEVIVHLFEEDRDPSIFLPKLRGMFGLALFDERTGELVLARDSLGIKPLYYCTDGNAVAFSSEVRALIKAGFATAEFDDEAVRGFLFWGSVQRPRTIFRAIRELAPGSYLRARGSTVDAHRWWSPEPDPYGWDAVDTRSLVLAAMRDSVSRHLVADQPVGVFLSGGVDSQFITLMAAERTKQLRTLTVTFPSSAFDEGPAGAALARSLGAEHVEVPVTGEEVAGDVDTIVGAMDQPTSDGVNTWVVSKAARESGLVVVLSGLGGDELFGGYPSFHQVPSVRRAAWVSSVLPRAARSTLAAWVDERSPGNRFARLFASDGTYFGAYATVRGLFPRDGDISSYMEDGSSFALVADIAARRTLEPRDWVMLLELTGYMSNQLLRDADQMSMSHSIELRVPWLDRSVLAAALSLPTELRNREIAVGPREEGPKRGFSLPFDEWMRGPLHDFVREGVLDRGLPFDDLIPVTARRTLWDAFTNGRTHWSRPWAVAVLRKWALQWKN